MAVKIQDFPYAIGSCNDSWFLPKMRLVDHQEVSTIHTLVAHVGKRNTLLNVKSIHN